MTLVESIPNVSEGRRLEILDRLAAAIEAEPEAALLDRTADPSHNRSVFTLAGSPAGVGRAILALAGAVLDTIDLRSHAGVHPRMGALDVVPFVPLAETPMTVAIDLARSVGAQLAERYGLPVFLYESAATRPERRRLEEVRRGGFEALARRLATEDWPPDFGPPTPHPRAGASAVGARGPLIAWNLHLASDRLEIAQALARAIRASSGGMPQVKALGLRLDHLGRVQVSMNLIDYRVTPMSRVFEEVDTRARALGVEIADSEVIGLVPREAVEDVARVAAWIGERHRHQVLEDRLAAAGFGFF